MKMNVLKRFTLLTVSAVMAVTLAACNNKKEEKQTSNTTTTTETAKSEAFPKFKGKDFDGKDVDESLFSKNDVTLVNFWFNGCAACVNEMPALEKFNKKLKEHGAELIGANVEASDEATLKDAKEILAKQGATYRNIVINSGDEAKAYLAKIFSFPTTVMVDKKGNIIGDPIVGNLEDEKKQEEIIKMIEQVKAGNSVSSTVTQGQVKEGQATGSNDELAALTAKENEVFAAHQDLWNKVFATMNKDQIEQTQNMPYDQVLKAQVEANKSQFSAEELKTLEEDIAKIAEIEKDLAEASAKASKEK